MARFVLSRSKALEQYGVVRELSDAVSYSVKTNPTLAPILEADTDSFFSIHLANSLGHVKDVKRVWFFVQGWAADDIRQLMDAGVDKFVVDNEHDLQQLLHYLEQNSCSIQLLLRMRLRERTMHTERHFAFGMAPQRVNELIPELKKNKSITVLGVHFHRKSQNMSEWNLKEELSELLSDEALQACDVINIGGGIPVRYKNHDSDVLSSVFEKIAQLKRWLNERQIQLIIEPGRFIAAPAIKLEATIQNVYDNVVVVDCSVYQGAMDTFVVPIRLHVEGEREHGTAYTVKGCTPDSLDVFRYRVYLDNPQRGDTIVFLNAGAYTYATDFCGLERIETIVVD